MAIKKSVPEPMFQASDGTMFKTESEALHYEKLTVAQREYEEKREIWKRLLLQTQKTRDDHPVDLWTLSSYWMVRGSCPPRLENLNHWHRDLIKVKDDGSISLGVVKEGYRDNRVSSWEEVVEYVSIDGLYREQKNAEIELASRLEEYAEQLCNEAAERLDRAQN